MTFKKHSFEIPYNGDPELIKEIASNDKYKDATKFIYLPCAEIHGETTTISYRATKGQTIASNALDAIRLIQDAGFEPCVLMQRGGSIKAIDFYYFFGVKCFTLGNDVLAREVREKYKDEVYLTASITKMLSHEDLMKAPTDIYDIWILPYIYSRSISKLKELPLSNKYGLMTNTGCLLNCPSLEEHWFPRKGQKPIINCGDLRYYEGEEKDKYGRLRMKIVGYVPPQDLWLFDPYIETYKLIDRASTTSNILAALDEYVNRKAVFTELDSLSNEERIEFYT